MLMLYFFWMLTYTLHTVRYGKVLSGMSLYVVSYSLIHAMCQVHPVCGTRNTPFLKVYIVGACTKHKT